MPPFDEAPNWPPLPSMPDDFEEMGPSGRSSTSQKGGPVSGKGPSSTSPRQYAEAAVGTFVAEAVAQTGAPVYIPEPQGANTPQQAVRAAISAAPVIAIPAGNTVPHADSTQPMRSENETALASAERAILEDRTNGSLDDRNIKKKILVHLRPDLDAHRGKLALKQSTDTCRAIREMTFVIIVK